jgi:hypothetical protein
MKDNLTHDENTHAQKELRRIPNELESPIKYWHILNQIH